jgi:hypothetical protein
MANGSLIFIALIALLVGALIGWLIRSAREREKRSFLGDAVVRVDRNGNVDQPEVTLDRTKGEIVFWVCEDRTKNLFIEFEKNSPFEGMVPNGKRWRVHCDKWTCFSRDIHSSAEGGGKRYKYWQVVESPGGTDKKEVDGWIRIQP